MPQPLDDIFRAANPLGSQEALLGLLVDLPGKWIGNGFNMIAKPARQGVPTNPPFLLEINATTETLELAAIGADIPNRGDSEPTISVHAVRYLQTVVDCEDHSGIHVEPGFWLHVPPTKENPGETYVRQAAIPHGDSLIAQSTFTASVSGPPRIASVDTFPFAMTQPIPTLNDTTHATLGAPYTDPFTTTPLPVACLPAGLDAAKVIRDPTEVLRAQIEGQTFLETKVIQITTAGLQNGGIVNIPFVAKNANVPQVDAIFWIEKFTHPRHPHRVFLQLQYVQRVILDFGGVHWPHVSVATLVKTL